MSKTTFGGLLEQFRSQKRLATEQARLAIKKRNKGETNTELRESKIVTSNGETVITLELWKKIDEEHIKLTTAVSTETLTKMQKRDELKDLLS